MSKVLASPLITQWLDNIAAPLNGGKLHTYEGSTTTPTTTWTSSAGSGATGAQQNPIVLDSAGREPGGIWVTPGVAYKFILTTSADVTIDTLDNVVVGTAATSSTTDYEVPLVYVGTPGAQEWMGGWHFKRAVTFSANFAGSGGSVITNPGSAFAIDVQKNGSTVGTVSISTSGVPTFTTTGGSSVSVADGDKFAFYGPSSVGTAVNFTITLVGALA